MEKIVNGLHFVAEPEKQGLNTVFALYVKPVDDEKNLLWIGDYPNMEKVTAFFDSLPNSEE